MNFPIERKLVVATSSRSLFDLADEHQIYLDKGISAFRAHQIANRTVVPQPGVAFPFVKGLLALNSVFPDELPVEVVVLSRCHADAGLRIMDAISHYGLGITRAFFLAGEKPFPYMRSLNAVLYLSTNETEVREAVSSGHPAGFVLPCRSVPDIDTADTGLRVAFDFDGVIVGDEADKVYSDGGIDEFHRHEAEHRGRPLPLGPLFPLLQRLSGIQKLRRPDEDGRPAIDVSILTSRNAPAHERLMHTLEAHDIDVDKIFITGSISKEGILNVLKPHIFFDDRIDHLLPAADRVPCAHIPFGVRNSAVNS